MAQVTMMPLTISLPLSTSWLSLAIPKIRSLSWYVDSCSRKYFSCPIAQLFEWDLESLWKTANQKRCHALLFAGRIGRSTRVVLI
ncbi:hypothetical protein BDR07DRAFT_637059 [Suillus spraguei]|nr:hypothetical protein BDR07DRAFT_637059 [Suillus spraguei]